MHLRGSILAAMISAHAFALGGCGGGGQWVEAPDVLYMFQQFARAEQLAKTNRLPTGQTRCEDHLDRAKRLIEKADGGNLVFQQMVRSCANAGLQFDSAARCKDGRLQVRCQ